MSADRAYSAHDAAFASELGLRPGSWPAMLEFKGRLYQRERCSRIDGAVDSVLYLSADGRTLTVWNDEI